MYQLSLSLRPRRTQGFQDNRTPNYRVVSRTLGRERAAEESGLCKCPSWAPGGCRQQEKSQKHLGWLKLEFQIKVEHAS